MNYPPARSRIAILGLIALLLAGCAATAPAVRRSSTVFIALRFENGSTVEPELVAKVHRDLAPELTRNGYTVAPSMEQADLVLVAVFAPVPGNPNKGSVNVRGLQKIGRAAGDDRGSRPVAETGAQPAQLEVERWGMSRSPRDPDIDWNKLMRNSGL
jgi:hypothetical protein